MPAFDNANDVLRAAITTLQAAGLGFEDFQSGNTPGRRLAGIRNVIVWGRAVTNVIQNLRTFHRETFDDWYRPKETEMRANPRFRYLYELRSQVLKEGSFGKTTASAHIAYMNTLDFASTPKPPNADSFFIGDEFGGSGWIVNLPDGSQRKFYTDIPSTVQATAWAQFATPTTEKGVAPPDQPIDRIFQEYLTYLSSLVSEAIELFGQR